MTGIITAGRGTTASLATTKRAGAMTVITIESEENVTDGAGVGPEAGAGAGAGAEVTAGAEAEAGVGVETDTTRSGSTRRMSATQTGGKTGITVMTLVAVTRTKTGTNTDVILATRRKRRGHETDILNFFKNMYKQKNYTKNIRFNAFFPYESLFLFFSTIDQMSVELLLMSKMCSFFLKKKKKKRLIRGEKNILGSVMVFKFGGK